MRAKRNNEPGAEKKRVQPDYRDRGDDKHQKGNRKSGVDPCVGEEMLAFQLKG
jgi:hypothetical protein